MLVNHSSQGTVITPSEEDEEPKEKNGAFKHVLEVIKLSYEQFRAKPDYLVILLSITATKVVANT